MVTGSVGLVSRFGQFYKAVDPGLVQVNVCTESLRVVDVKIQIISIGRQTVITRDNVNVEMYVPLLLCQPFPSPTSPLFTRSIFWWMD
jgi:erythrocyte band 7 integral membrane protein